MKTFVTLLKTFFLLELRTKEVSVVAVSTVLLVAMLLAMGVGTAFLDPYSISKVFPFIFWTTVITSCSVSLGRSFENELKCGIMDALVSSGVALRAIFFAKQIVVTTILFISMLLGLGLLSIIFQVELIKTAGTLAVLCLILAAAYSALGNILSVVALGSRLKSALLPMILIPASFPLFFASLELTYAILKDEPEIFSSPWFGLSIFLAILYSLLGAALFPSAIKAQL